MKGFYIAIVRNGRLVLDEPVDLPDGTLLELALVDHGSDPLDAEERAELVSVIALFDGTASTLFDGSGSVPEHA